MALVPSWAGSFCVRGIILGIVGCLTAPLLYPLDAKAYCPLTVTVQNVSRHYKCPLKENRPFENHGSTRISIIWPCQHLRPHWVAISVFFLFLEDTIHSAPGLESAVPSAWECQRECHLLLSGFQQHPAENRSLPPSLSLTSQRFLSSVALCP